MTRPSAGGRTIFCETGEETGTNAREREEQQTSSVPFWSWPGNHREGMVSVVLGRMEVAEVL